MSTELAPEKKPLVVSVEMGYGHLRAARSLADKLGERVWHVDRAPLADAEERKIWQRVRDAYELTSRLSSLPVLGAPLKWALDELTSIPHLHPHRDLSAPTRGARTLDRLIRRNLGRGLVAELRRTGRPLLTTFYSPAVLADSAGLERIYCVVTDTDVNRVWAPVDARNTRIRYLVPTHRAAKRLRAYGVPHERITFTGFPLPDELVGGPDLPVLIRNLAARIVRLDPDGEFRSEHREELAHFVGPLPEAEESRPPLVTFAVGGAGAQAELAAQFLPSMRRALEEGRLRLALVAGAKEKVRQVFEECLRAARLEGALGRGVEILYRSDLDEYFAAMNELLARTDVLWTKPSEMCFYAALGLPLVCGPPVGVHERFNRRWVREAGAGVKQRDARFAGEWLGDMLSEGALAAAAWAGFMRLPKFGLYRILETVAAGAVAPALAASERNAVRRDGRHDAQPVRETRGRYGTFDWPDLEAMFTERLAGEDFSGATVLDLGTGAGRLALLLAPRSKHVIGVDTDAGALDAARERARELRLPNVTFLAADADAADYRDLVPGGIDSVVACHFMSVPAIRSAAAALRPGGRLVFVCHHRDNWIETGRVGRFSFDERNMRTLLEEAGFAVEFLGIDRTVVAYGDLRALAAAHPKLRAKFEHDGRWQVLRERFGEGPAELTWAALVCTAAKRSAAGT